MHTTLQRFPWWAVDLEVLAQIHQMRIYNRIDHPEYSARLRHFFIEVSADGDEWEMVYAKYDEAVIGGADGAPLIVAPDPHAPARFVKITLVDEGFLHLDQVEVYGEPVANAPRAVTRARAAPPVVHVESRGGIGNRVVQFLVAHALASRVPDCVISNVALPAWNIGLPLVPRSDAPTVRIGPLDMRLDLDGLGKQLRSSALARVEIDSVVRHIGNFPPRTRAAALIPLGLTDARGFGPEHLVINLRGNDVYYAPRPNQTLIPGAFYEELVAQTGLVPIFMGEIGANAYVEDLRRRFPRAVFLPSRGPLTDFETLRRSRNIAVSVSVFSWLAAWLSDAERVFLPMSGFLNPFQAPEIDLLPLDDARYRFHLFPINHAVPAAEFATAHRAMTGAWRLVTPAMLREMRACRPRFGDTNLLVEAAFDEAFYLARTDGVADAIARGEFGSGLQHFREVGEREGRDPFPFDQAWYARTYRIAAIEVGQGDFLSLHHHYVAVGRDRGYLPIAPPTRSETWNEIVRRHAAAAATNPSLAAW